MKTLGAPARLLLVSTLGVLGWGLAGCGGAGHDDARGSQSDPDRSASAKFSIVWPEASKLIPIASRAIQIDVLQGSRKVASKTAARGAAGSTTTIDIPNIPAGNLTFEASALPNVDTSGTATNGSGVPQAKGSAPLLTEAGKTSKITLTMNSTIVRLAIFPNPWQIKRLAPTVPARATAYDAQDRIVMTDVDEQFQWSTANNGILTISPNSGAIEGLMLGTTTISVRDKESGKTATGSVEVVEELPVDRVLLSPATLTLEPNAASTLTAQAVDEEGEDLGYAADRFDWTSSDPTKATVDTSGRVVAVAQGTTTITAKERVTGKSGTAVVTVQTAEIGNVFVGVRPNGQSDFVLGRITSSTSYETIPTARGPLLNNVCRTGERTLYFVDEGGDQSGLNGRRLYSERIDGSERKALATFNTDDGASWFPNADGTKVLLCIAPSYRNPTAPMRLDLIDVASGVATPQSIPNIPSEGAMLLAWSPRGDRYVLGSVTRDSGGQGSYNAYFVTASGNVVRELPFTSGDVNIFGFHFSRSGDLVAYEELKRDLSGRTLVIADANGTLVTRPSAQDFSGEFKFHPASEKIIYVGHNLSSGIDTIYEMEPNGASRRTIYSSPYADQINLLWDAR